MLKYLSHALKYKPYKFHFDVIEVDGVILHYRHTTFRGFIQFAHYRSKSGRQGLVISSHDKSY